MNPQFYLGLSIAFLALPLGFVIGFNLSRSNELKKFNDSKLHILTRVIE